MKQTVTQLKSILENLKSSKSFITTTEVSNKENDVKELESLIEFFSDKDCKDKLTFNSNLFKSFKLSKKYKLVS